MIDPRALQEHFKRVHQNETPQPVKIVPRVADIPALTAVKAIPVIAEPVELKTEISELHEILLETPEIVPELNPTETEQVINETTKQTEETEKVIEETIEETAYGYSATETKEENTEEYNPYGYYSKPLF